MKINNQPLVSVGIPTYNRSESLKRALDSVINQTYLNIEIIVSDNCSSVKDVQEVMNGYVSDPRVRFIQQVVNKGAVFNFNFLSATATGDFFMWLADDDWLDRNYIESCLNFLIVYPDYAAAYGYARIYDLQQEFVEYDTTISLEQESNMERVNFYLENVTYNGCFSALFRREHKPFLQIKDVIAADWLIIMRIAFIGKYKMLTTTNKHISQGGSSSSIDNLTKNMPLFTRSFPYLSIALNVTWDILFGSKVYRKLNIVERATLAKSCFITIYKKYFIRAEIKVGAEKWLAFRKKQIIKISRRFSARKVAK